MRQVRIYVVLVLACALLATGCNRDGHSRKFRKSANQALKTLRAAGETESASALMQADTAIAEAKTKIENNQDLHTSDALGWYAALLHRRNRERTANWRAICDAEIGARLEGEAEGRARILSNTGLADKVIKPGDCQVAFFTMLNEDCSRSAGAACEPPPRQ